METDPTLSIVIPCYNHGQHLTAAVQSALRTSRTVEVVIVDDGSTDATAEVIASFERGEPRVRSVRQANAGVVSARNRGLRECRGEFVVFLDADDLLVAGGLDLGAAALDAHPECAFAFGRYQLMTADGALVPTQIEPRIGADHYRELMRRNYIGVTATVMFRRDALERAGGFNPSVMATADYELYLHIARHHPVHDHGQIVAHHRAHDASVHADVSRRLRETLTVLREQRRFLVGDLASLDAYEDGRRHWQDVYGEQIATEMRAAMASGDWSHAAGRFCALARYNPRMARQAVQSLSVGRRLSLVK